MSTEILAPVGNIESFFAAIDAQADAIYLGFGSLNARRRAKNFSSEQLNSMVQIAHKKSIKVYLVLNTVFKNSEIRALISYLSLAIKMEIDAVIIQDLGLLYILQHYFKIEFHSSTQFGVHNSLGTSFAFQEGFSRSILSREITYNELKTITKKSQIEIEIFIHGALCYCFSGACLFSSYIGGNSGNRGLCKQPCRRSFVNNNQKSQPFSLQDLWTVDILEDLQKLNITSFKIEGRMRNAEYVYKVVKTYKSLLKHEISLSEAKILLNSDLARSKTGYFLQKEIAINNGSMGLYLGQVYSKESRYFLTAKNSFDIKGTYRIETHENHDAKTFKFSEILNAKKQKITNVSTGETVFLKSSSNCLNEGKLFLIKTNQYKFPKYIPKVEIKRNIQQETKIYKRILSDCQSFSKQKMNSLFSMRINSIQWLKKIDFHKISKLIINFSKQDLKILNLEQGLILKNQNKIILQLPLFISEDDILFYKKTINNYEKLGYKNIMISHISQIEIIPSKLNIITSENIYIHNDLAIKYLLSKNIKDFCYPQEIDKETLSNLRYKTGIMPIFFKPQLFFSRLPIKYPHNFTDNFQSSYQKKIIDGKTIILPEKIVSLVKELKYLTNIGIHHFLIDLSFIEPIKNPLFKILNSNYFQKTSSFNWKRKLE